jgi:ubiquinone/menaquinone biosynthesis C-methylase UbiE
MKPEDYLAIAPCLKDGPLAEAGLEFIDKATSMGGGNFSDMLKTWAAYYLFVSAEAAFEGDADPTPAIVSAIRNLSNLFASAPPLAPVLPGISNVSNEPMNTIEGIETETGNHYGHLFKAFDDQHYFVEAADLLRIRLARNGIDLDRLGGWDVLDAGCGGGRYSAAWAELGAGSVTGVDFSEIGIRTAQERTGGRFGQIRFEVGDVLALPFPDESFDCTFSNGVLHHTRDWQKGVHEIVRVLKPGGLGWLYLIENPGGYFWDIIEILRLLLGHVDKALARATLRLMGVPTNRIFYILDHILVPINLRLTEREIESCLADAGAKTIRKLRRGADFDRIERIFNNAPFAGMKYGVGEQRYVFSK